MNRWQQRDVLVEKNDALCQQLQQNRRLIATRFVAEQSAFPRSKTMRFLVSKPTHTIVARISYALLAVRLIRHAIRYYSLFQTVGLPIRDQRLSLKPPQD